MSAAKALEVDQWIATQACEALRHTVPDSQLLRMRWVLTFKSAGNEAEHAGKMKATARIVILGFSDPHLLEVETASPAMSRLSKQLFLQMCSTRRWRALKADVKSAFLQAESPQRDRRVYARPLRDACGKDESFKQGCSSSSPQLLRSGQCSKGVVPRCPSHSREFGCRKTGE